MSTTEHVPVSTRTTRDRGDVVKMDKKENVKNYKGFVAGVFSGIAKLSGKFNQFSMFISTLPLLISISRLQIQFFPFCIHPPKYHHGYNKTLTPHQSATLSTQSKSASKPLPQPASRAPSNASPKPSAKKVSSASTKAPLHPS